MIETLIQPITNNGAGQITPTGTAWIRLGDLRSDPRYQRSMNQKVVQAMADTWDDNKAEVVTVNQRADGSRWWVVEGQKRSSAKRLRFGDDAFILCKMVYLDGWMEEKNLFDEINGRRTKPTGGDTARGDLNCNLEPMPSICAIAKNHGLHIQFNGVVAGGSNPKDWSGILYTPWLRSAYKRHTLNGVLAIVGSCFFKEPQSTTAVFLSGLEAFLTRYGADLTTKEWAKLRRGLEQITPQQVISRANDLASWRGANDRISEALVSLTKGYLPRRVTRKD